PLMSEVSPFVLVHFQFEANGKITSPQVPVGRFEEMAVPTYLSAEQYTDYKARLESLKKEVVPETLLAQLPAAEAAMSLPAIFEQNPMANSGNAMNSLVQSVPNAANSSIPPNNSAPNRQANPPPQSPGSDRNDTAGQQRQESLP